MERARLLMGVGRFKDALQSIEAVLASAPLHVQAWALKATCFENTPLLLHLATAVRRRADAVAPTALQRRAAAEKVEEARARNRIRVVPIEQGVCVLLLMLLLLLLLVVVVVLLLLLLLLLLFARVRLRVCVRVFARVCACASCRCLARVWRGR